MIRESGVEVEISWVILKAARCPYVAICTDKMVFRSGDAVNGEFYVLAPL
jgi:hypothetical protein